MSDCEELSEQGLTETTYSLGTDGRTDGQSGHEWPQKYISVRVTVSHSSVMFMLEEVFKSMEYICYKHKGLKTHKEHVHVLVTDVTASDKIRKRLSRSEYKGNQSYSIKQFDNGLLCGIQYASKEGTEPIYVGDFADAIASAPKWVESRQRKVDDYLSRSEVKGKERSWQLTYSNVVRQAVIHARYNRITHFSFKEVLQHMVEHTNWAPCYSMVTHGLPDFYADHYQQQVGNYKLGQKLDMSWYSFKG